MSNIVFGTLSSTTKWLNDFLEYESNFDGRPALHFQQTRPDVPILLVAAYLWFIFYIPQRFPDRKPLNIKGLVAVWNLLLTTFSIFGAIRASSHMVSVVRKHGFQFTLCKDTEEQGFLDGAPGLWTTMFVFSKFPELFDTVLYVLRGKPFIFLHWFHHVTVALYTWHASANKVGYGMWFLVINYWVHSIMYLYYFLTTIGYYRFAKAFAMPITFIQTSQMVVGITLILMAQVYHEDLGEAKCHSDFANYRLGLAMYISYFALFAQFFVNKYMDKRNKQP